MKLKPEQLTHHLAHSPLSTVYLLCGDEPLRLEESAKQLRMHLVAQEFVDRAHWIVDANDFSWEEIFQSAQTYSLFSTKRVFELELITGNIGTKGSEILQQLVRLMLSDVCLILIAHKLDNSLQQTAWFKAVEKAGVVILHWPLEKAGLSQWLQQRALAKGLKISRDGFSALLENTQGNLLALDQMLEKLILLYGSSAVSADELLTVIHDAAQYDIFNLVDSALAGNLADVLRILAYLKNTQVEPTLLLWAITREIRQLIKIILMVQKGESLSVVYKSLAIWPKRQPLYANAQKQHTLESCEQLLEKAAFLDKRVKGLIPGDYWLEMYDLVMGLGGSPPLQKGVGAAGDRGI